jgi:cytochrome c-type biogenesis protein CcmH/NrfG
MTLSDQELDRRLTALTRTCDAPESLWQRIGPRLSRRRRNGLLAAVAGVAAVLMVALALFQSEPALSPAHHTMVSAEVEAMRRQAPSAAWALPVDSKGGVHAAWQENLAAIAELEQALERNPGNTLLLEFLARARLRQSELINLATMQFTADPGLST